MSEIVTARPSTPPAMQTATTDYLDMLERLLRDQTVDMGRIQAAMDMQERLTTRRAVEAYNQARARLAMRLPRIKKGGVVSYPENKNNPDGPKKKAFNFARWEDIDEVIRPILQDEGFVLSFSSMVNPSGGIVVIGKLLHDAGHFEETHVPLTIDSSGGKNNLQGIGSSTSYGQRYATKMLLNLIFEDEDDDGVRGGMTFLSPEQVAELQGLIDANKIAKDAFLEWLGGGGPEDAPVSLESIQQKDFARAKNALLTRKRKVGAPA